MNDPIENAAAAPPANAIEALLGQSRSLVDAGVHAWTDASCAFAVGLARDCAEAVEAIGRCRTPLDGLAVAQRWAGARTQASLQTTAALLFAALHEPEAAVAETAEFRLPE